MATTNKFIVGDIVEDTLGSQGRISWLDYDEHKAGVVSKENAYGHWEGGVKPLAELKLVEPSVHVNRPLKPINEMDESELREHVRLLREGRQESIVRVNEKSSGSKSKKKKRKKKKKKKSKRAKLKEKYPDLDSDKLEAVVDMGEDWADKFVDGFSKKE